MDLSGLTYGLAGGITGYNNQVDLERKRAQEDRLAQFQDEQAAWARLQRQRVTDEQSRSDRLRATIAGIPTTKTVETTPTIPKDDEGNAMPPVQSTMPRRQDEILRDQADAVQKYGNDPVAAFQIRAQAEQAQLAEATRRMSQVVNNAKGKTAAQIVQDAAQIYNTDPLDGEVADVQPTPDGQGATVTFKNKRTNQTMVKEFKTPDEAIAGLRSYLDPAGAQALLAQRQAAELKVWEEQVKAQAKEQAAPLKGSPGDVVRPGVNDPRPGFTVPPLPTKTGDGSGSGKGPKTPYDLGREILADAFEKGDVKAASPAQRADAEDYLDRIIRSNPGIPPARAAKIAAVAATDPSKSTPRIDPRSGKINLDFKDSDGSTYTLLPGYTSLAELEKRGFDKAAIAKTVQDMVAEQGDPAAQKAFVAAAFDPAVGAKVADSIKAGASKAIDEAIAKNKASPNPVPEQEIRQRGADMVGQAMDAYARKLEMVRSYMEPPKPEKKPAGVPAVGGLQAKNDDPNSPAGRWRSRQEQLRAQDSERQAARQAAQDELSKQFRSDASTMDPLTLAQKYDSLRWKLPTADAAELQRIERMIR